jgi:uncharacterized membrane protein
MSRRSLTRETVRPTRGRLNYEVALVAVFAGLAVALGYLRYLLVPIPIPNVELITFTVFIAGVMLGRWRGALVGAISATIYYGVNPLFGSSVAMPPLYAAQIGSLTLAGLVGGLSGPLWRRGGGGRRGGTAAVLGGAFGLVVTVVFQGLLILGLAVSMPSVGGVSFAAALVSNALPALVHIVWNTLLFALLLPVVPRRLERTLSRRLDR